jgi:hypothetical protein
MMHTISPDEMSKKLKPILGERIDKIYLNYLFTDDLDKKRQIAQFIQALYSKFVNQDMLKNQIFLEPPKKEQVAGEYPVGIVSYANTDLHTFNLRENDWQRHICITGMSGSGKTTLAYQLLKNLIDKDKPFLVMDWKKSFRPLMTISDDVLLFTIGNDTISNGFRININRPPKGVPPKEWISIITDVVIESFNASHGTATILSDVLDQAYHDFKVYEGSENYPTWYQIMDRLSEMEADKTRSKRETEWIASAIRIAHSLTFGDYGKCVNTKGMNETNVEELLKNKVVFELYSLNTSQKKFFCEFILTYIYKLKKSNNQISKGFEHAIIVDEAHNIFLKDKATFMKETVTDMIYREMREYGISLICLDQHISKLSETVVGNSACTIAFQQMLPQDVEIITKLMQLTDIEQKNYFPMLQVGQAIVRLAERFNSPFLVKIPFIQLKKEFVNDEFVINRMNEYLKLRSIMKALDVSKEPTFREEMEVLRKKVYQAGWVATTDELVELHSKEPEPLRNIVTDLINDDEKRFLTLIKRERLSVSEAYRLLGLSGRKGTAIKESLEKKQLIAVVEEKNDKGWKKIIMPLEGEISVKAMA